MKALTLAIAWSCAFVPGWSSASDLAALESRVASIAAGAGDDVGVGLRHLPSGETVLVRGRPNPLQAAGRDSGLKLMEIKRLRAKGHDITLLTDAQFWKLAARR